MPRHGAPILIKRFSAVRFLEFVLAGRVDEYGRPYSPQMLADEIGITKSTVHKWRSTNQFFTIWQADRFACKMGVHPSAIWDDYWDTDADRSVPVA